MTTTIRRGVASIGTILFAWMACWGYQCFAKDMPEAQRSSSRFIELLKVGDLDPALVEEAYAGTCSAFRAEHSLETFGDFVAHIGPSLKGSTRERSSVRVTISPSGKRAVVKYLIRNSANSRTCTVELLEEGGAWKVYRIAIGHVEE
jgi:hypothetical protein